MNNIEFSNEIDVKLNSFGEGTGISLDEYEKSLVLTQAQETIVEQLYNGNLGLSFEESEGLRRYLSDLVRTVIIEKPVINSTHKHISKNSKFFMLPDNLWFITYESIIIKDQSECKDGNELMVTPIAQDEYRRTFGNPFRGPNERRALRLDVNDNMVEIVSRYEIDKYKVRYIKKLSPIILTYLPDELTIQGKKEITNCELHPALHKSILEEAVKLAIKMKSLGAGGS